jgi:hypothetical protein
VLVPANATKTDLDWKREIELALKCSLSIAIGRGARDPNAMFNLFATQQAPRFARWRGL